MTGPTVIIKELSHFKTPPPAAKRSAPLGWRSSEWLCRSAASCEAGVDETFLTLCL